MEDFTVKELNFCYPSAKRASLCDISFSVQSGEWVTVCGLSGCGKSTLLRQLKTCLQPCGTRTGTILYQGQLLEQVDLAVQAAQIGFVQQSPEHQSVTDKVWHELAFGLESLGQPTALIRQRVAETASFFGMESWYERTVDALSGGQKQLLNVAAVMVLQPSVLILDEPTAQLDPIAAGELIGWLRKINTELGTTIIISEHHLDEVYAFSDRILVLSEGRLLSDTTPQQTSRLLYEQHHAAFYSLPSPTRIFEMVPQSTAQTPPLCAAQGRSWLKDYLQEHPPQSVAENDTPPTEKRPVCWEGQELWFRYDKDTPDILKGCSLKLYQGEFLTILGGNGTGKTTLLSLIAGLHRPYRGQMQKDGKKIPLKGGFLQGTAFLPQDPRTVFVRKIVREDLYEMLTDSGLSPQEQEERIQYVTALCDITALLEQHPYDLSGGEQQKAALAKILLTEPTLLLLDEPTKGLDCAYQYRLVEILRRLTDKGTAIVAVSHDVEFCAAYADRCALLFNGQIVSEGAAKTFFAANSLYTTAVCRMTKGLLPQAVTVRDVLTALGQTVPEEDFFSGGKGCPPDHEKTENAPSEHHRQQRKAVTIAHTIRGYIFRGLLLTVCVISLLCCAGVLTVPILSDWPAVSYGVLFTAVILFLMVSVKGKTLLPVTAGKRRFRSEMAAALTVFLIVPLTIAGGLWLLDDTKYLFLSLLVLLESTIPFFWLFEKRNIQTRELVLIAVLCAIGVGGRALFYILPACKPVTALVIMSAVALGSESGFLIGATVMLVSNFFFGQGLWTPWQMMAMGLVGYSAGKLFHRGFCPASRAAVAVYGFAAALVIYGGIMNPTTILLSRTPLTWQALLAVYAAGLPSDTIHAAATALFLYFGAEPLSYQLERIKKKYGLMR